MSLYLIMHHKIKAYGGTQELLCSYFMTSWRSVVSLMPQVLYLSGKSHLLLTEEEVAYTTELVWIQ
jgi:hypothetical protein